MGKGDGRRPMNKDHALNPNELDMGSIGCKNGHHVFRGELNCTYCKKSREELSNARTSRRTGKDGRTDITRSGKDEVTDSNPS